jgi:hypothetical protein
MKKMVVVFAVLLFVLGMFVLSCQKQEGTQQTPAQGEKAPGYGQQEKSPGYGEQEKSPGYGEQEKSPGYGQ